MKIFNFIIVNHIFLYYSLIHKYISEAIFRIDKNKNSLKSDQEMGVLEKLLKIDRNAAFVMATDMLLAGVDTVSNFYLNYL